jgi:hypothetical protein
VGALHRALFCAVHDLLLHVPKEVSEGRWTRLLGAAADLRCLPATAALLFFAAHCAEPRSHPGPSLPPVVSGAGAGAGTGGQLSWGAPALVLLLAEVAAARARARARTTKRHGADDDDDAVGASEGELWAVAVHATTDHDAPPPSDDADGEVKVDRAA